MGRWVGRWVNGWLDGRVGRWISEYMDGWVGGWMDGQWIGIWLWPFWAVVCENPALQQMPMFCYSFGPMSNCQGQGTGGSEVLGFSLKLLGPYN